VDIENWFTVFVGKWGGAWVFFLPDIMDLRKLATAAHHGSFSSPLCSALAPVGCFLGVRLISYWYSSNFHALGPYLLELRF
jgi:hypothetical protein